MALSSDPASGILPSGSQVTEVIISNLDQGDLVLREEGDITRSQDSKHPHDSPVAMEVAAVQEAQQLKEVVDSLPLEMPTVKTRTSFEGRGAEFIASSAPENLGSSFYSTPGYLANRWNLANSSFSTPPSSHTAHITTPPM